MHKIFLCSILFSSLSFCEVYYKDEDLKYNSRDTSYMNGDNRNYRNNNYNQNSDSDQIRVDGYVTRVKKWSDYTTIEIKLKDSKYIKAKVGNNDGFSENDIVYGTCVNYRSGQYERCSLHRR